MAHLNRILDVSGIYIQVVRKNVKNINFVISKPDGRVRVSVPKNITDEELNLVLSSKLGWMRKKIQIIKNLPTLPKKKYVSGEEHYFIGKPYKLEVIEQTGKPHISLQTSETLQMYIRPKTSIANREKLLNEWYRRELKKLIPFLIEKWQPIIGIKVSEWGVKRMKTRWGTCNINKKRIWLNLELAKRPEACVEYVVVHEMTHLLERNHNARFKKLLDGFVPEWQYIEGMLETSRLL